jgi:N-formylglutamate amidohydrolase
MAGFRAVKRSQAERAQAAMHHQSYPPWVVLHIPHDSMVVPAQARPQFLLTDSALTLELQRMTDHFTHALFAEPSGDATVVRAPVSRLVVDVERFADDRAEPMAARGMGAVYSVTSHLAPLRRPLSRAERDALLNHWYHAHHEKLEAAVALALERHGRCLLIDGHSFPGCALPYEGADPNKERPDICIGSDTFHTPRALEQAFAKAFAREGWRVAINDPFAGALVPQSRYRSDPRVEAVMVEVNRDLYLDPVGFEPKPEFARIAAEVKRNCIEAALAYAAAGAKGAGR